MRDRTITVLLLVCLCALHVWALAPISSETMENYSSAAMLVSARISRDHLEKTSLDDTLAKNALDIFIKSLDFDHTFFMQSDIDGFRGRSSQMDDGLKEGNLDFAFDIYDTFIRRVSNRVAYVNKIMDEDFDMGRPESYVWRRKDLAWAASTNEWNDIWRKKVKHLYIGRTVSDRLDEERVVAEGAPVAEEDAWNEENDVAEESDSIKLETPEESIRKQYKQLLSVLSDNDAHWLLTLYITSFARAMDPHSDYMSQRDIEDFNIGMKKSLSGIGALLRSEDGAAKIMRIIPGGPAEKNGVLKANDKIIAVAQGDEEAVDIRHWPLSRAVGLIRGEKGSKVVLSVIPASDITGTKVREITVIRDEVKLDEQVAKAKVESVNDGGANTYNIGVITIPDFYVDMQAVRRGDSSARAVTKDVRKIITDLKATNQIDGLVLDLRDNGGGALNEAVDLTGLFIDSGPVVQVKNQGWMPRKLYDVDPEQIYKGPLVVLVNRFSASASEILAAALQDYKRAVIVGDSKTHGKGTVQALLPLHRSNKGLGSLKLTTAGFYRIAGSSTQLTGVHSDIVIPSILDYMEVGEEYQPHALNLSSVKPAFYWSNNKLKKQIPVLRKHSQERREKDEQFQQYIKLLEHIGERQKSESISLELATRMESAREERKMNDMAMDLDVSEAGAVVETDEEPKKDIVLDETLRIMADMIGMAKIDAIADGGAIAKSRTL